jgi:Domain of unknown function (DUF6916)
MAAIDQLTADDFVGYVGKTFRPAETNLDLALARIDKPTFPGWDGALRQPFSLILRGPPSPILPEGARRVAIEDGPCLTLYIIPIFTAAHEHQDYQVVFN